MGQRDSERERSLLAQPGAGPHGHVAVLPAGLRRGVVMEPALVGQESRLVCASEFQSAPADSRAWRPGHYGYGHHGYFILRFVSPRLMEIGRASCRERV